MIKATKGLSPVCVHFYDDGCATVYNLTQSQFDLLMGSDRGREIGPGVAEDFEIKLGHEVGYAPDYMSTLSVIYGFELESE